jgi:hypothetical protein
LDTVALIEDHYIKERQLSTDTVDFLQHSIESNGVTVDSNVASEAPKVVSQA